MGYWSKCVKRLFGSASVIEIQESWEAKSLEGTLQGTVEFPKDFKELGGEVRLRVSSKPDRRYESEGEVGSFLVLHFSHVAFPEPPG